MEITVQWIQIAHRDIICYVKMEYVHVHQQLITCLRVPDVVGLYLLTKKIIYKNSVYHIK